MVKCPMTMMQRHLFHVWQAGGTLSHMWIAASSDRLPQMSSHCCHAELGRPNQYGTYDNGHAHPQINPAQGEWYVDRRKLDVCVDMSSLAVGITDQNW